MTHSKKKPPQEAPGDLGGEAESRAMDAALRSSFVILKCVIALLVVFLIFSNTKTVEDGQEGAIVLYLGKARTKAEDVWKPGLRFALPYPIEEVKMLDAAREVVTEFAWTQYPAKKDTEIEMEKPRINASNPTHGYLLTQDKKALHLKAKLNYSITDPNQFAFGFHDVKRGEKEIPGVEIILKVILERSLTDAARERTLEQIIHRQLFREKVEGHVKRLMGEYNLGVELKGIIEIDFGGQDKQAIPAFARAGWLDYINQDIKSQTVIDKAKGDAHSITNNIPELVDIARKVENERKDTIDSLKVITTQFTNILAKYQTPLARRRRMDEMYLESIKRIAQNPKVEIWLVPRGSPARTTRIRLQIKKSKQADE